MIPQTVIDSTEQFVTNAAADGITAVAEDIYYDHADDEWIADMVMYTANGALYDRTSVIVG